MINTNCSECIFSDKVYSKRSCFFDIVDSVKDKKNIVIKDGYYYIENYQCKYCFSKKANEKHQNYIQNINIAEEIKQRNLIKYTMVIDLKDYHDDCKKFIDQINQLAIKPAYLVLLFYSQRMRENINTIQTHINKNIKWKAHNFIFQDLDYNQALKVATDTNQDIVSIPFLWIEKPENLDYLISNNSITKINFIVNVEQPVCNFIRSKNNIKNNFHNMFMSYSTYRHITKNLDSSLEKGIDQLENTTTVYYD